VNGYVATSLVVLMSEVLIHFVFEFVVDMMYDERRFVMSTCELKVLTLRRRTLSTYTSAGFLMVPHYTLSLKNSYVCNTHTWIAYIFFRLGPSWSQAVYGFITLDRTSLLRARLYTSKANPKLEPNVWTKHVKSIYHVKCL
jgi:hypothetical protein